MTSGQTVTVDYQGQHVSATVLLVSPNGRSLMLGFEGLLHVDHEGELCAYLGAMPVLMDERGVFRDLVAGLPVEIHPEHMQ